MSYERYRIEELEKKVEKLERKAEGGSSVGCLAIVLLFIAAIAWPFGSAWLGEKVPDSVAIEAVEAHGFTNPVILEREHGITFVHIMDNVVFTVEATNPLGRTVTLKVFSGYPRMISTIGIEGTGDKE